jgi:hypothetical protein
MSTHDTQFVIIIDCSYAARICCCFNFLAALRRRGTAETKARRKLHRQILLWDMALPRCTSMYFANDFSKHRVLLQDKIKSR